MVATLELYLAERILSPSTVEQYRIAARQWDLVCPANASLCPSEASPARAAFVINRLLAQGIKPATLRPRLGCCRSLVAFGAERGWWPMPAKWPKIRVPSREPVALSTDEFSRLLTACSNWKVPVTGRRIARHWTAANMVALALVIWETGERINALLQISAKNLDARGGTLFVPAEARKGKRADKRHALSPATIQRLQSLSPSPDGRLFSWPGKVQSLRLHWHAILESAGLRSDRQSLFHCLRRTHATHLTAVAGIEAASHSLGHSSVAVTKRSYVAASLLPTIRPCDLLPAINF
jgi:integrase